MRRFLPKSTADRNVGLAVLAAFLVVFAFQHGADAAVMGGGGYPWDTTLTNLKNDITGPTAFAIALIAGAVVLASYAFGSELHGVAKYVVFIIMVLSAITGLASGAAAFGIAGAVVA